ncbi:hypothetical protein [Clostridium grantii]|nr:hypothetical protein [Clostridium grantii]
MIACSALICKGLDITRKYKNRQVFTENGKRSENGVRIRWSLNK